MATALYSNVTGKRTAAGIAAGAAKGPAEGGSGGGVVKSSSGGSSSSSKSGGGSSSSVINIDSNPSQALAPGQVYTYKGQTYTQPGASSSNSGGSSGSTASQTKQAPTISSANLKVGSTDTQAIKDLQTKLGMTGAAVDGIFGTKTKAAVVAYQNANNLTPDGIVGINTAAKMNATTSIINPANPTQPANTTTPFSMNQATYTVQPGDTNNPYNGEPLTDTKPGAVISKDTASSSYEDYNKSGDTPSNNYYGATARNASAEQDSLTNEKAFSKIAGSSNLVSSNFLNTLSSDPSIMAFYINAMTYGGYQLGDVLNDMKRRELISQGGTNVDTLKKLTIIDPEQNRNTYQATTSGQKSVSGTATMIPTFNFQGLLNPEILKYGSNMPDDLFKTLVPILDPTSDAFKQAVEDVKSKYFDLTSAQLQATTEQEKSVADYNLQQFKEQLQKNYGIALSDDATKAWTQIETIADSFNTRNLSGSGLQNEAIDETLQATRKADQRLRDEKLTKEEQNKAAYYRASATDEEINKLTPEERLKLGLTPSSEIINQFSITNLKAKNPSWTDEMVKQARDAVIDKYGNYRSAIYAKYYGNIASTGQTNQTTAVNTVKQDALNKEAQAYKDYSTNTAFLGQTATGTNPNTLSTPSDTTSLTAAAKQAENIKNSLSNTPVTPPATVNTIITPVTPTPTSNPSLTTPINIDSNPGQTLKPGQVYTYKGVTYTQPGA